MSLDERVYILENALFEVNEESEFTKTVVSKTWLQMITPGAVHSSANTVFRSILSSEEVEKQIDQVTKMYQTLGVPFRWLVTPLTEPKNTEAKLIEKGFSLLYEAEGLLVEVDKVIKAHADHISVREVKRDELKLYIDTFAKSWGVTAEQKAEASKFVEAAFKKNRGFHAFVAFYENEPVGNSILIECASGAYLAAAGVVGSHRGQGIYRAMISERAKVAKQLGHKHLLIHAKKESSAPICRALGFEWVYDFKVYEYVQ
jgi:GNAT superfamily N-acetyltransferase